MHAAVRSAQHNHCYLCMRSVTSAIFRALFMVECPQELEHSCNFDIPYAPCLY